MAVDFDPDDAFDSELAEAADEVSKSSSLAALQPPASWGGPVRDQRATSSRRGPLQEFLRGLAPGDPGAELYQATQESQATQDYSATQGSPRVGPIERPTRPNTSDLWAAIGIQDLLHGNLSSAATSRCSQGQRCRRPSHNVAGSAVESASLEDSGEQEEPPTQLVPSQADAADAGRDGPWLCRAAVGRAPALTAALAATHVSAPSLTSDYADTMPLPEAAEPVPVASEARQWRPDSAASALSTHDSAGAETLSLMGVPPTDEPMLAAYPETLPKPAPEPAQAPNRGGTSPLRLDKTADNAAAGDLAGSEEAASAVVVEGDERVEGEPQAAAAGGAADPIACGAETAEVATLPEKRTVAATTSGAARAIRRRLRLKVAVAGRRQAVAEQEPVPAKVTVVASSRRAGRSRRSTRGSVPAGDEGPAAGSCAVEAGVPPAAPSSSAASSSGAPATVANVATPARRGRGASSKGQGASSSEKGERRVGVQRGRPAAGCSLKSAGHTLRPAQLGHRVAVVGDGWGGGSGGYEAVVTEADRHTFTVIAVSGPDAWKETHVLQDCCIPLAQKTKGNMQPPTPRPAKSRRLAE